MAKRGLSAEEKKEALLAMLHSTKEPYSMPDLEAEALQRGIRNGKEACQELEFEGRVHVIKVGSTAFYYAFPSTAAIDKLNKQAELQKEADKQAAAVIELEGARTAARKSRKHPDRANKLQFLATLKQDNAKLKDQLTQYAESDPEKFEELKEQARLAVEAANRWTDNIWNVKQWAVGKFNVQPADFDKAFAIAPTMDYLDPDLPDV